MTVLSIALIMLDIFSLYVGFITYKYGVLHSISQSYYELRKTNKDIYFTLFCWAMAACSIMLFAVLEPDYPSKAPLFFGSAAGLAFVGAARAFYESLTDIVHYVGAGLGFGLAIVAIFLMTPQDGVAWTILMASILVPLAGFALNIKHLIWWAELWLFLMIFLGLLTL